ncbi:hypothetical protein PILCRDRAFT_300977 [Piloderma croceum F 1598]|uniref:Uncharacterized protein n=1 Tax=Piloderma croceum (strain F 1598) TaxID=765440 RepID=A0A0C3BL37_PILCF|nr:hypothetical protein PILCRDRAFT_300977 [Piloderma croceum F 1598]
MPFSKCRVSEPSHLTFGSQQLVRSCSGLRATGHLSAAKVVSERTVLSSIHPTPTGQKPVILIHHRNTAEVQAVVAVLRHLQDGALRRPPHDRPQGGTLRLAGVTQVLRGLKPPTQARIKAVVGQIQRTARGPMPRMRRVTSHPHRPGVHGAMHLQLIRVIVAGGGVIVLMLRVQNPAAGEVPREDGVPLKALRKLVKQVVKGIQVERANRP